jgi:hypothetical protein
MDKKFLDKVVDQIVSETRIDYDKERLYTPFRPSLFFSFPPVSFRFPYSFSFSYHCEEIYSLNEQEIEYVWNEYKHIIIDKINNG